MCRIMFVVLICSATLATPTLVNAQGQAVERRLWWNDPAIVEQVGLGSEQRQQMDRAFESYDKSVAPIRRRGISRKPYFEALRKGEWDDAETELDRWLETEQVPKRAMAELKLAVLKMLSDEQRAKLGEKYPRLVFRSWDPAAHWAGAKPKDRPPRKPENAKERKKKETKP